VFEGLRALGIGGDGLYRWLGVPGLLAAPTTGSWLPEGNWWWWHASRPFTDANFLGKITTVIAEFPAFSLLLGDLHPHVMALPLVMLALWLATELYRLVREGSAPLLDRTGRALCLLTPLWLGALGFGNSWDLPTFLAVALAALWLGHWHAPARNRRTLLGMALYSGYLIAGSLLFYLPFYWTLSSQAQGIGLAYYTKTPLRGYLLCFGVWLVPVLGEAWRIWRAQGTQRKTLVWLWLGVLALPWLATLALGGWGRVLLGLGVVLARGPWLTLALSGLIAVYAVGLGGHGGPPLQESRLLARLLILAALCLTYATEFVYLRDLFEARMNTVFKVYYQAWVLFGIGALAALQAGAKRPENQPGLETRSAPRPLRPYHVALAVLCLTLYYPIAAAYTRARANPLAPTLDGTAYLASTDPDAYGSYRWVAENAGPEDVLVEAPGEEYDASTNRLSAWTGVPTLLGWAGHEAQWRGDERETDARLPDIEAIYTNTDAAQVLAALHQYGATLLYVGTYERAKYAIGAERLAWYATFLQPVYAQGQERLYRVPAPLENNKGHLSGD